MTLLLGLNAGILAGIIIATFSEKYAFVSFGTGLTTLAALFAYRRGADSNRKKRGAHP